MLHGSLGRDELTKFPTRIRAPLVRRRLRETDRSREPVNNIARKTLNPFCRALSTQRVYARERNWIISIASLFVFIHKG